MVILEQESLIPNLRIRVHYRNTVINLMKCSTRNLQWPISSWVKQLFYLTVFLQRRWSIKSNAESKPTERPLYIKAIFNISDTARRKLYFFTVT